MVSPGVVNVPVLMDREDVVLVVAAAVVVAPDVVVVVVEDLLPTCSVAELVVGVVVGGDANRVAGIISVNTVRMSVGGFVQPLSSSAYPSREQKANVLPVINSSPEEGFVV